LAWLGLAWLSSEFKWAADHTTASGAKFNDEEAVLAAPQNAFFATKGDNTIFANSYK
jgi:hypothetical protein